MGDAEEDRRQAAKFADGDVLNVLYGHHALIRDLFEDVAGAKGEQRKSAFMRLAKVLQAHETAEEAVVRPLTARLAGDKVAAERIAEESEADEVVATLLELDVDSAEFDEQFRKLHHAVDEHAEAEENQEFPSLEDSQSEGERKELGQRFLDEFYAAGGGD